MHRFWRSNATAYMAMPYYPGRTLKDVRLEMPAAPGEAWLRGLIEPVLGALEQLHAHGVYHRDIAPDNILVLPDGRPVLLDFGCARRAVAGGSQWFTAHLKPQFAPLEQYADEGSVGQGPWTDLYSLGATLHFVVTGRAPTASVARAVRDTLPALSSLPRPGLSPGLLATIDWTLALAPGDRPRDVETVRRALRGEIAPPPPRRMPIEAGDPGAAAAPVAPEGMAPKREALQGDGVPLAAGRADRGVHWGAALSIAFAALAALGWGPWALTEASPAATPPSVDPVATERLVVPERLADAMPPIVVVPAVADAPRGEAVEPVGGLRAADIGARSGRGRRQAGAFLEGAPGKTAAVDRRPRRPGRLQWRRCAPADPRPVRPEPLSRSRWPDPGPVPGSSACRRGAAAAHGLARVTRLRAAMRRTANG